MPNFHCPHCNTRISAGPEQAGQIAPCPVCQQAFVVPDATDDTAAVPLVPQAWMVSTPPVPPPPTRRPSKVKRVHALALVAMMLSLLAVVSYSLPQLMPWYVSEPAPPPMLSAKQFAAQEIQKVIHQADGKPCGNCKGSGKVDARCRLCTGLGTLVTNSGYTVVCPDCKGTGTAPTPCPACKGTGVFHVP